MATWRSQVRLGACRLSPVFVCLTCSQCLVFPLPPPCTCVVPAPPVTATGACEDEIARFCAKVEPGEGRLEDCLTHQLEEEEEGDSKGGWDQGAGATSRCGGLYSGAGKGGGWMGCPVHRWVPGWLVGQ